MSFLIVDGRSEIDDLLSWIRHCNTLLLFAISFNILTCLIWKPKYRFWIYWWVLRIASMHMESENWWLGQILWSSENFRHFNRELRNSDLNTTSLYERAKDKVICILSAVTSAICLSDLNLSQIFYTGRLLCRILANKAVGSAFAFHEHLFLFTFCCVIGSPPWGRWAGQ